MFIVVPIGKIVAMNADCDLFLIEFAAVIALFYLYN